MAISLVTDGLFKKIYVQAITNNMAYNSYMHLKKYNYSVLGSCERLLKNFYSLLIMKCDIFSSLVNCWNGCLNCVGKGFWYNVT